MGPSTCDLIATAVTALGGMPHKAIALHYESKSLPDKISSLPGVCPISPLAFRLLWPSEIATELIKNLVSQPSTSVNNRTCTQSTRPPNGPPSHRSLPSKSYKGGH